MDFSLWQIAIVLVIALLVFGPKRLPSLGRSLGSGMKEFKDSITGKGGTSDEDSIGGSLGSGMREFRDSISGPDETRDEKERRPIDGSAQELGAEERASAEPRA